MAATAQSMTFIHSSCTASAHETSWQDKYSLVAARQITDRSFYTKTRRAAEGRCKRGHDIPRTSHSTSPADIRNMSTARAREIIPPQCPPATLEAILSPPV